MLATKLNLYHIHMKSEQFITRLRREVGKMSSGLFCGYFDKWTGAKFALNGFFWEVMIATWISNKSPFKSDRVLLHRFPVKKSRPNGCLDFERNPSSKIMKRSSKTLQEPRPQNATTIYPIATIIQLSDTVTKGASRWIKWAINWAIQFHLQMLHWSALTTCHLTRRDAAADWLARRWPVEKGVFFLKHSFEAASHKKWGLRKHASLFRTSFMKHIFVCDCRCMNKKSLAPSKAGTFYIFTSYRSLVH